MEMGPSNSKFSDTKAGWGQVFLCLPSIWHNKNSRPEKTVWLQTTVETCGYINLWGLGEQNQGVARGLGDISLHIQHCAQRQN